MTTPEAPAEVAQFQISVCGTCDVVFRVHAGRPSCPVCGGDPNQVLVEGVVEVGSGGAPALAEGETAQRCRVCGCTDEHACEGGCSWVEPGLCSRCVGRTTPEEKPKRRSARPKHI